MKLWSKVLQIFLLFSLYFSSLNLKYLKLTKMDITRFAMKLFIFWLITSPINNWHIYEIVLKHIPNGCSKRATLSQQIDQSHYQFLLQRAFYLIMFYFCGHHVTWKLPFSMQSNFHSTLIVVTWNNQKLYCQHWQNLDMKCLWGISIRTISSLLIQLWVLFRN